jgi:hypothetical protein
MYLDATGSGRWNSVGLRANSSSYDCTSSSIANVIAARGISVYMVIFATATAGGIAKNFVSSLLNEHSVEVNDVIFKKVRQKIMYYLFIFIKDQVCWSLLAANKGIVKYTALLICQLSSAPG